jgi:hypothetical protein
MSDIFKKGTSSLEKIERGLKKIESELWEESSALMLATITDTFDVEPGQQGIPAEWTAELMSAPEGEEREAKQRELKRRARIAAYALLPPKEAPVALQIAAKVHAGMVKARAVGDQGNKTLNVNVVTINAPMPVFEEKEIEHE